uniref:Homeobox protein Rhox5 n=1 Tax=Mus minutoides TaxID=10105 RepID=RHOX5_MUSMI|nr:RecName: Full=Homeobox protein Rhox5; AltName: Full=Homeobox protein Pem; AltName: Full=Placenta and embryonic expression protein; AltName: Full=Reproductive homeobox on chromosome X 5 [Mus minutoides]AAF00510.1 homeobox protein [Mus minutoides]
MEAQSSSRQVTGPLYLGVKEDWEEQHDVKAEAFLQAGEGRKEKGAQGQPGVGAVGKEGEGEELSGGEGQFGPGAPGPMGDEDKDGGTRAGGVEEEQNEPAAEGTESQKNGKPEDRQMPLQGSRFAQQRLSELQSILQRTNSFDVPREDLYRLMDTCVARVQNWFKIRRAAARRNRRRTTPVPEHFRGTFECPACRGVRWGERCPFATPRF